jgi:hypothetical protein
MMLHATTGATVRLARGNTTPSSTTTTARIASVPHRRSASAASSRGAMTRVRASHLTVDSEDVYEDDVDYSGNLCMFLDSASEEEWAKWLPSVGGPVQVDSPVQLTHSLESLLVAQPLEPSKLIKCDVMIS